MLNKSERAEQLRVFLAAHKWSVICVAAGFLAALLLLTVGFWRTVLLCLFVIGGFLLGRELDKRGAGRITAFFQKLFDKGNHT